MKKRISALLLTLTLALGAAPMSAAYDTPDFSDVPANHWAYPTIMEMADKGVMKGVGQGRFDPEGTITAEMFIVLVGRVIFPDIQTQGKDWSGPYVEAFKENNYLWHTNITDETLKAPITRYDMAQLLRKPVELMGVKTYTNNSITYGDGVRDEDIDPRALQDLAEWGSTMEDIADYKEIPDQYGVAVNTVHAVGLMRGDENARFNGGNTTTRMEAATVISRLMERKEGAAAARKLRVELVTQELAALLSDDPTQEELAQAMFQEERRWVLHLFRTGETTAFTKEEQETIRQELGLSSELYQAARSTARQRVDLVEEAEQGTQKLSPESVASMSAEDLAWCLRARVNDLEPRDVKALMDKRGLSSKDFLTRYLETEQYAQRFTETYYKNKELRNAAEIAVTAAKLAKEEGEETFTFRAYGRTPAPKRYDFSKCHLGLFGEDGRLIGKPELDKNNGRWEMEITISTDHLDEVFTLKLLEPYEAHGYYMSPGMEEEIATMKELISGDFCFYLVKAEQRFITIT